MNVSIEVTKENLQLLNQIVVDTKDIRKLKKFELQEKKAELQAVIAELDKEIIIVDKV